MSKKRDRLKANLGAFLRQYGRRGPSRIDANDRKYSRKIEEAVKRMDPIELDRILRGENERFPGAGLVAMAANEARTFSRCPRCGKTWDLYAVYHCPACDAIFCMLRAKGSR